MHSWSKRTFYLLVIVALAQIVYYYPQMPAVIASHFDGAGVPNAWSGRNGFFMLCLVMILLLIGIFDLLPRWTENRIGFAKNIPHKEYWLAPERIAQTRAFFRKQMMLSGVLHLLLVIAVMQLAIQANFSTPPRIHDSIYWALGLYFLLLILWLVHFFRYFRKP